MDPSGELNQNKIPFQKLCDTFSKKIVPNPTPTPPHTPHPTLLILTRKVDFFLAQRPDFLYFHEKNYSACLRKLNLTN